jgi:hypothetical protein
VDTVANVVLKEIPTGSYDPTPDVIRQGRGFLYDSKLSGNGTMACAACHIDAEMDLIAWDLGDPTGTLQTNRSLNLLTGQTNNSIFHPMKGPMTTQTLRGLNTLDPFHWRGDRTNFSHFNIAFPGLMGNSALTTADMSAYSNFINTITFEPNPNQNLDRTYPTNFGGGNAVIGKIAFLTTNYVGAPAPGLGLQCNNCHTGPPGPGSNRLIISGSALQESQDFKVPQLRAIYQKLNFNNAPGTNSIGGFGFTHDGTDPSLQVFLSRPIVFANINSNTVVKNNLAAFVECFDTGTAPAVGYSRTITAANVGTAATNDWALLESQAAALTNIDLIAKGTVNGHVRGLLYQPGTGTYRPDTTNMTALTHADLLAKIQNGDRLTFMGVPPGSGTRMGIDRDEDGVLDGDVPLPKLAISLGSNSAVLNWPLGPAGFSLQSASGLVGGSWSTAPGAVEILGSRNYQTNPLSSGAVFYRLVGPVP